MEDMVGKSMSVDSEAVVHTALAVYIVQAVVLMLDDAPVLSVQYSLSLMHPIYPVGISYHSRIVLFLLKHLLFS
jgi:hypothetical protein